MGNELSSAGGQSITVSIFWAVFIRSVKKLISPYTQPDPAYQKGQQVYKANEIVNGRRVRKKRYICCSRVTNGVIEYRLKDVPGGPFVTDWISEHQLREFI